MNAFYKIGVIFGLFIVYTTITLTIGGVMAVLTDEEPETWFFWAWVCGMLFFSFSSCIR